LTRSRLAPIHGLVAYSDQPTRKAGVKLDERIVRRFDVAARGTAIAVILIGALVLGGGWLLGVDALRGFGGEVTMKANTAFCLVLCGCSLLLLRSPGRYRRAGRACAVPAGLIGIVTLVEHMTGWNAGIDQLLFRDAPASAMTVAPGRMSPQTAAAFVLTSAALLNLDWTPRGRWPAGLLAGAIGTLAATMLLGHIYQVESFYIFESFTAMAAHTAAAFLLLAVGISCARPRRGMTAILAGDSPAGVTMRSLLPPALIVPPIVGTLVMSGQRQGFYGDGEGIWLLVLATVMGCGVFAIAVAQSLQSADAGRRQAERRLRDQERKYRTMIEQLPLITYAHALNDTDTPLYVSPQVEPTLGYTTEEWPARQARCELMHPDDRERVMAGLARFRATGVPFRCEYRLRARDGRYVWVQDETVRVLDPDGRTVYAQGYMLDITDRKAAEEEAGTLEEQLNQAQKLESIGRLAGGVAHDFNNVLAAIIAYAGFADEKAQQHPEVLEDIVQIRRAAERGSELIQSLLVFGRRDIVRTRVIDLNQAVVETESLLRPLLGDCHVMRIAGAPERLRVEADPSQLERLLMNLVLNARAAMPGGGTVEVSIMEVDLDSDTAPVDLEPGRYAAIAVSDTGTGMASDVAARAFEPFFTTKSKGEGTGLGLAIVYSIAKRLGGHVEIDSKPGEGTQVRLLLPAVDTEPDVVGPEPMRHRPKGNGDVVLVVDDDEQLRRLTARILSTNGYAVLEASDGADALEKFRQADPRPAMIVTDVAMPRMTGTELAERIAAGEPETRVVFMSGYAEDLEALGDDAPLVAKPFSADVLLSAVSEALR
jgi:PAS domain S-box-containing protein